jgi:hypothetical protein
MLQLCDQFAVEGVETHLNIWQLADWKLLYPCKDFPESNDSLIFLFLGEVWIDVIKTVHSFIFLGG